MGKHFGKCALCRKECELTFEHIPPRAAFNSFPTKPVSGDQLFIDNMRMPWDTKGLRYNNEQRGMGLYSLCNDCNNKTGSWYGGAYVEIAHGIHGALSKPVPEDAARIQMNDIYPLRFIKQILSMFCSVNNIEDKRLDPIREFVLDKNATNLDSSKNRVYMYYTKTMLVKYASITSLLYKTKDSYEIHVVSEITAYPLGFVLSFGSNDVMKGQGIDITEFSKYGYDDVITVETGICINEMNDVLPTLYRSREEVETFVNESNRLSKELDGGAKYDD